ncbi:hypothetical protein KUCAC02_020299, partial [Chaenocephalus aceratus]
SHLSLSSPVSQSCRLGKTSGCMNRRTVDPRPGLKDGPTAPSSHRRERRRPFVNLATAAAHLDLATAARAHPASPSSPKHSAGVPMRGGQPRLRSTKLSDTAVKHNLCASLSPGCQG